MGNGAPGAGIPAPPAERVAGRLGSGPAPAAYMKEFEAKHG